LNREFHAGGKPAQVVEVQIMKNSVAAIAAVLLAATPLAAGPAKPVVSGQYVEARTAEVFTGGCIMNSEAETMGRHAVLAWRIDQGSAGRTSLDGLAAVAVVTGDRNLGMREMGGEAPTTVRALILVDERATPAQRDALAGFVRTMTGTLIDEVVAVRPAPIAFGRAGNRIDVTAPDIRLSVDTVVKHDPGCGAMQWFHPLSTLEDAAIGLTTSQAYSGGALGVRWQQAGRRSAFWGSF
jgi:hypothetical protein